MSAHASRRALNGAKHVAETTQMTAGLDLESAPELEGLRCITGDLVVNSLSVVHVIADRVFVSMLTGDVPQHESRDFR